MSAFLALITSLSSAVTPFLPIAGAVWGLLSPIASYFVGKYVARKQAEANAITTMAQDEDAHSSDGDLSVGDMNSIQAQDADLQQQLAVIDAQKEQAVVHPVLTLPQENKK